MEDIHVIDALLDPAGIDRLRAALTAAGYTAEGIAARLGPEATRAVQRNDFRAAIRATAAGAPIDTLIRLFIAGQTVTEAAVSAALPLPDVRDAGLVERYGPGYRAGVELEPYGEWWVVSDVSTALRPGAPLRRDHVLGVGAASTTLAKATSRARVDSALDLGTGCGVQALHLSTHATAVTATDLSPRALSFAATTAALNGLSWDLREGDLARPVRGERFDLVVSNPPFVAGPGATTHTYRDSGRAGDAVCAELVAAAPTLLKPGGTIRFLANWLHVRGEDWVDRVAGWLAGTGLDAWVIQREVSDPISYVNLWLSDAGEDQAPVSPSATNAAGGDTARRVEWLDWFDAHGVEAVGLGLVTLRAGGHDDPTVRIEDLRQPVDRLGDEIEAWFGRQDWLRDHPARALLDCRLRRAPDLRLRQEASAGDAGWQVDGQRLALASGLRWVEDIDPVAVMLVGGCDGGLRLGDQLDLLAAAHDVAPAVLVEVAVPLVAHLVERGFLIPVKD